MRRGRRALLAVTAAVVGGLFGAPAAPGVRAQSAVPVPATVDPTGVTDVTAQVQRFIDSVPDGQTAQFSSGARYRIEGTILVAGRRDLTIDGNGARFFATTDGSDAAPAADYQVRNWPRRRVHFLADGGSGIAFRNLVVDGGHTAAGTGDDAYVEAVEGQHGVEFRGVAGGSLRRCEITRVRGDFVTISRSARDITVSDCRMSRNGRQGVAITDATNVVVERNVIAHVRRSAIDVEPASATWDVANVVVRDNEIGPARLLALASKGAGGRVRDITFEGNRLVGLPLQVYAGSSDGARRSNYRIVGNRSDTPFGSPNAAMRFVRIDGVVVRGNHQALNPDRSAIAVSTEESCSVTVEANTFPGSRVTWDDDGFDCTSLPPTTPPPVVVVTRTPGAQGAGGGAGGAASAGDASGGAAGAAAAGAGGGTGAAGAGGAGAGVGPAGAGGAADDAGLATVEAAAAGEDGADGAAAGAAAAPGPGQPPGWLVGLSTALAVLLLASVTFGAARVGRRALER